ncbi:hypothetical protein ACTD5D_40275 [Nocardia takedensis]|uniref:hypothetical protein n=1 Tax=Nocardia takedensis TaxID=259390 RepID=UPI003F766F7A
MADHELSAAQIAWWAVATTVEQPLVAIYDEYGFDSFEAVRDDLVASMRARGLTLELAGIDSDWADYEFHLFDGTGRRAGRACIMHATEIPEPPAPAPSPGTYAPWWPLHDDPPF